MPQSELCSKWAEVSWEGRRKGRPIQADAWNGASALHDQVLDHDNAADYEITGHLQLLVPERFVGLHRPGGLCHIYLG